MGINNILKYADPFWGNGGSMAPAGRGIAKHWNWLKAQTGNTHPGAVMPFGWVSVLPYSGAYSTGYGRNGNSCCGKAPVVSDRDYALGMTHFHSSGAGYLGEFYNYMLVTPCSKTGDRNRPAELENPIASPGYFCGHLKQYKVDFELTATAFAALHRYNFPDGSGSIRIDCTQIGLAMPPMKGQECVHSFHCERDDNGICSGFVFAHGCYLYYAIAISGEVKDFSLFNGVMEFDIASGKAELALGFSLLSEEEAKARACEAQQLTFAGARQQAEAAWSQVLGKIHADFDSETDKKIFYSTLYHSCIKPVDAGKEFTDFQTMWDMYHTQLPLMMTIAPQTAVRMLHSMLETIFRKGSFPCCKMMSTSTRHEMQATALVIYTLVDGFFHGLLTGKDYPELKKAFTLQFKNSDLAGKSLTHTLDLAGAYHAASLVALACKDHDSAQMWREASAMWRNAYGDSGLLKEDSVYYEGTHWNYSFRPHVDMNERVELAGGKDGFEALLDKFFGFGCQDTYDSVRPVIENRFEGMNNESDMVAPASWIWCGRADKQALIHDTIRRNMFLDGPGGCPGNNDSGALSSWYVWSALGFYPVSGSGYCLLASPLIRRAEIVLADGKLNIEVIRECEEAIYPAGYEFNGKTFHEPWLAWKELLKDGVLKFYLSATPKSGSAIPDWF